MCDPVGRADCVPTLKFIRRFAAKVAINRLLGGSKASKLSSAIDGVLLNRILVAVAAGMIWFAVKFDVPFALAMQIHYCQLFVVSLHNDFRT